MTTIFFIPRKGSYTLLICDGCGKEFKFPIGIDGVTNIDNPKFVCSIKCMMNIDKEVISN